MSSTGRSQTARFLRVTSATRLSSKTKSWKRRDRRVTSASTRVNRSRKEKFAETTPILVSCTTHRHDRTYERLQMGWVAAVRKPLNRSEFLRPRPARKSNQFHISVGRVEMTTPPTSVRAVRQ